MEITLLAIIAILISLFSLMGNLYIIILIIKEAYKIKKLRTKKRKRK